MEWCSEHDRDDSIPYLSENIYLTGSVGALTDWSTTDAILMSSADYPVWSSASTLFCSCVWADPTSFLAAVTLPANTDIQYKYITVDSGDVTWESDPNNEFTTPTSGITTRNDVWR